MGSPNMSGVLGGRYELVSLEPQRRGCWGEVYEARDIVNNQRLAVKMLAPTELAKEQMAYRKLTLRQVANKEIRQLTPSAHLMPTIPAEDGNGTPCIIMPWYDTFFNDTLASAKEHHKKTDTTTQTNILRGLAHRSAREYRGMTKELCPSGLSLDEILHYAENLAASIAEFQHIEKRAHGDIKPENIAIDDADSKRQYPNLVLADFGTATTASVPSPNSPRDNMGCIYTRSPKLLQEGAHPQHSSDIYAFGSMLFNMFSGEYPLEQEIDTAMREGGLGAVKALMGVDATKQNNRKLSSATPELETLVQRTLYLGQREMAEPYTTMTHRVEKAGYIPKEFQRLINDCLLERIHTGERLPTDVRTTIQSYRERIAREEERVAVTKTLMKRLVGGLAGGAAVAGALLGFAWLEFSADKPDWAKRTDIYASIVRHNAKETAGVGLQVEREYTRLPDAKEAAMNPHDTDPSFREPEETVVHIAGDEFLRTAEQLGYRAHERGLTKYSVEPQGFFGSNGVIQREFDLPWKFIAQQLTGVSQEGSSALWRQSIDTVMEYALGASVVSQAAYPTAPIEDQSRMSSRDRTAWIDTPQIDLEDAYARVLLGGPAVTSAMKETNSTDYADYSRKFTAVEREFIEQWLYNTTQRMPDKVFLRGTRGAPHW